jgi:hypothetical protein
LLQSRTSGSSRSEAADGSLVFVRIALMGGRFAGADDPEDIACLHLNVHHEQKPRPRGHSKDQQSVRMRARRRRRSPLPRRSPSACAGSTPPCAGPRRKTCHLSWLRGAPGSRRCGSRPCVARDAFPRAGPERRRDRRATTSPELSAARTAQVTRSATDGSMQSGGFWLACATRYSTRSAICTATSTFALSRGCRGRAGNTVVP